MSVLAVAYLASVSYNRARSRADAFPIDDASVAVADTFSMTEGGPSVALDVLANDIFFTPRGDITIDLNLSGTSGTGIAVDDNNNVTYKPPASARTDIFAYTINGSAPATVTIAVKPVGSEGFERLPAANGTVTATDGNLADLINTAPAGRQIRVPPGTYAGRAVNCANGTQANPVILRPSDPANPPRFNGTWDVSGGGLQFWGIDFRNHNGEATSGGTKNVRLYGNDVGWYYCDIEPAGIGIEVANTSVRRWRTHRCRMHNPAPGTGAGREVLKTGVSGSGRVAHAGLVDYCLFQDFVGERESISIKGQIHMYRCHGIGCRDIAFRHVGIRSIVEETRWVGSQARIPVNGADHIIRNVVCPTVEVWRGTHSGDSTVSGSSGVYLAALRATLQRVTANVIRVAPYPFESTQGSTYGAIQATGTTASNNSVAVTISNGASVGTAPTIAAVEPPFLTSATTGVLAYATYAAP